MVDGENLKWLIDMILAMVSAFLTAFYRMGAKIAKVDDKVDSVREDYVRRDDLEARLKRNEKGFDKIDEKPDRLITRK